MASSKLLGYFSGQFIIPQGSWSSFGNDHKFILY